MREMLEEYNVIQNKDCDPLTLKKWDYLNDQYCWIPNKNDYYLDHRKKNRREIINDITTH